MSSNQGSARQRRDVKNRGRGNLQSTQPSAPNSDLFVPVKEQKTIDDVKTHDLYSDVEIKSSDLIPLEAKSIEFLRETSAGKVAVLLIIIFGVSLLLSFIIVGVLIYVLRESSQEILSGMNSILEVIKIIGAIFSPLLAFILGYYFGLSNKSSSSGHK